MILGIIAAANRLISKIGVYLNGADEYFTFEDWTPLSTVARVEYDTDNDDGYVIDISALPATEAGRVGENYHFGKITALKLVDPTTIQGGSFMESAVTGSRGAVFDPITWDNFRISFDTIPTKLGQGGTAGWEQIIVGGTLSDGGQLFMGFNTGVFKVAFAGTHDTAGASYTFENNRAYNIAVEIQKSGTTYNIAYFVDGVAAGTNTATGASFTTRLAAVGRSRTLYTNVLVANLHIENLDTGDYVHYPNKDDAGDELRDIGPLAKHGEWQVGGVAMGDSAANAARVSYPVIDRIFDFSVVGEISYTGDATGQVTLNSINSDNWDGIQAFVAIGPLLNGIDEYFTFDRWPQITMPYLTGGAWEAIYTTTGSDAYVIDEVTAGVELTRGGRIGDNYHNGRLTALELYTDFPAQGAAVMGCGSNSGRLTCAQARFADITPAGDWRFSGWMRTTGSRGFGDRSSTTSAIGTSSGNTNFFVRGPSMGGIGTYFAHPTASGNGNSFSFYEVEYTAATDSIQAWINGIDVTSTWLGEGLTGFAGMVFNTIGANGFGGTGTNTTGEQPFRTIIGAKLVDVAAGVTYHWPNADDVGGELRDVGGTGHHGTWYYNDVPMTSTEWDAYRVTYGSYNRVFDFSVDGQITYTGDVTGTATLYGIDASNWEDDGDPVINPGNLAPQTVDGWALARDSGSIDMTGGTLTLTATEANATHGFYTTLTGLISGATYRITADATRVGTVSTESLRVNNTDTTMASSNLLVTTVFSSGGTATIDSTFVASGDPIYLGLIRYGTISVNDTVTLSNISITLVE